MKSLRFCFLAAGALLFLLFVSGASAQQLFDSWVNYKTPNQPSSVFSVDIDGDGDLDLIICHQQIDATGKNPIVIFKNNGAGFFQRDTTLYTRGAPVQVTAKDLDQDGDIDIVTDNPGSNRVSIFKNRGGTAGFELPLDCPVGHGPRTVVLDYMNDDSVPDILTCNLTDGTASILINHGAASFPAETTKVLGINPRSITAFDLDNDGDKDIAASLRIFVDQATKTYLGINGIVVTENKGNGRFDDSARVFFKIPLGNDTTRTDTVHNPVRVAAADFNGDGYSDLALVCSADTFANRQNVFIYLNVPSRGGVYRSTDNGTSWTRVVSGLTNNEPRAFAVSASGEVFAGTVGGGVYRSANNGASWTASNIGLSNTTVLAMAIDTSGRLFAGTLGGGVFRSTDNGANWGEVNSGIVNTNVRALLVNRPFNHLFAGTAGGVFRSTNGGASWSKIISGLADTLVTALAINTDSGQIFAGTPSGVFRSRDNGQHWVKFVTGLSNTNITALAAKNGGIVFAGTAGGGVFRSTNYGVSWAAANSGLSNLQIRALAAHPSGDIYAGTSTGGVFRSTDNGASWTAANSGLFNTKVLSLAVGSGGQIFAGTNGSLNGASFARPVAYRVGTNCSYIYAGDLDGDGDIDLAAANAGSANVPSTISILKNNGNGTFAPQVSYFSPATPIWVEGGDFDRDGDIDLAVVSQFGSSMAILRNKGNGTFETGQEFSTGTNNEPYGIAAADLEPDGDVDVVVGNLGGNVITIHRNNGSGSFPTSNLMFAGNPIKVAIADLDRDGDLDIACANKSLGGQADASIEIFLNSGGGNFPPASSAQYPLAIGSGPQSIVAADLDGDGNIDLATPNLGNNTVAVLKNNGNGTYSAGQYYTAGSQPNDIKAADFDRNGFNDLAVTNYGLSDVLDSVSVFPNDGSGAFPSRTDYLVGSFPTGLDAADFNEDGWPDIAATVAGGGAVKDTAVVVYINDQTGGFLTGVRYLPAPGPAAVVVAADMNGDGHLDIVTADSVVNTVSVFLNNPDSIGTFLPATEYGAGLKPRGLAVGDFNGDGYLDLAVANQFSVSATNRGAFTILTNLSNSLVIAKGDLNGDGVVNLTDVTQELNCAFFGTGSCQTGRADLNCDGKVTLLDVVFIVRKVFGGTPFPCS